MRSSFRAVIFDLDDTLFDCTGALVEASRWRAAGALVECGLPMSVEDAYSLQQTLTEKHGPYFLVFDEIGRRYGLDEDALEAAYRAYNSDEVGDDIAPFSDAVPTLQMLRRQGILCFLLTVGSHRRQQAKISKLGLQDQFDDILVSDVDRGALMGECVRYFLDKYRLNPSEVLIVGDRPGEEIRVGNQLGMGTAQMLRGRFSLAEARDRFEIPNYRIKHLFQVPTILRLSDMGKTPESLRVLTIGGGTGVPIVLEGCKAYCRSLVAVVAVTDSGRSTGKVRDEFGMLAPGDIRNCLVAMSEPGEKEQQLNEFFQYRFSSNGSLQGMSLGNLMIAAATMMTGSFNRGIKIISNLLNIRGKVLPSTVSDCELSAELEDGSLLEGEVAVRGLNKPRIRRLFLQPAGAEALPETVDEIKAADIIVIGPGSLFTSVLPNILVPGVREAVAQSPAAKYYVCNIMTQPGQTDGFSASDHYRTLASYVGEKVVDAMLVNSTRPADDIIQRYRREGAEIVQLDRGLQELNVRVVQTDMVEETHELPVPWEKQYLLRHHPHKLGDAICRLYGDVQLL